jgi:hypothetical protein
VWWFTPIIPALRRQRQEDLQPELHSKTLSQQNETKKQNKQNKANDTEANWKEFPMSKSETIEKKKIRSWIATRKIK